MNSYPDQTLLQETITVNADYHAQLCATISDLAYVDTAKKEQTTLINDLKDKLETGNRLAIELSKKTARERKDYEDLRDSKSRLFVHRIVGRKDMFELKQKKEEREYVEALEMQMKERENCQTVKSQLDRAEEHILELDKKKKVYDAAVSERDELYCRIFDDSLREIPEQTPLKDAFLDAQYNLNNLQRLLDDEKKASEYLSQAVKKANICGDYINEAQNNSGYEMWPVAPTAFAKVQDAIKSAQTAAGELRALVEAAIRLCDSVIPVGDINIHADALLSGLNFGNFLTDITFAAKLKEAKAQVLQTKDRLTRQQDVVSTRTTCSARSLKGAADKVDECRSSLTELRRTMFTKFGKFPAYDNGLLVETLNTQKGIREGDENV